MAKYDQHSEACVVKLVNFIQSGGASTRTESGPRSAQFSPQTRRRLLADEDGDGGGRAGAQQLLAQHAKVHGHTLDGLDGKGRARTPPRPTARYPSGGGAADAVSPIGWGAGPGHQLGWSPSTGGELATSPRSLHPGSGSRHGIDGRWSARADGGLSPRRAREEERARSPPASRGRRRRPPPARPS